MLPPPYLQKRYVSNNIVVEIWSDGYCVQSGGTTWSDNLVSTGFNIKFPQPYNSNNYVISLSMGRSDGWSSGGQVQWNSTTATGFRIWGQDIQGVHWIVRGYIR